MALHNKTASASLDFAMHMTQTQVVPALDPGTPIYSGGFAMQLIKRRMQEYSIWDEARFKTFRMGERFPLGPFECAAAPLLSHCSDVPLACGPAVEHAAGNRPPCVACVLKSLLMACVVEHVLSFDMVIRISRGQEHASQRAGCLLPLLASLRRACNTAIAHACHVQEPKMDPCHA